MPFWPFATKQEVSPPKLDRYSGTPNLLQDSISRFSLGSHDVVNTDEQIIPAPREASTAKIPRGVGERKVTAENTANPKLRSEASVVCLPTKEGFVAVAGNPKDDLKLRHLTIWRNSTAYKDILSQLSDYHTVLAEQIAEFDTRDGKESAAAIEILDGRINALKRLSVGIERYGNSSKHTHKDVVKSLGDQVNSEIDLLEDLKNQISGVFDEGRMKYVALDEAVKCAREGIPVSKAYVRGMREEWRLCQDELTNDVSEFDKGLSKKAAQDILKASIERLVRLAESAERYCGVSNSSHSEDMESFRDEVEKEIVVLERLHARIESPFFYFGKLKEVTLPKALESGRQNEWLLEDNAVNTPFIAKTSVAIERPRGRQRYADFTPEESQRLAKIGRTGADPKVAAETRKNLGSSYTFDGMCLLLERGLGPGAAQQYQFFGIPVTKETIVQYTDADVVGRMEQLGHGHLNTVYQATYRGADGKEFEGVFKPESIGGGDFALSTGISMTEPRYGLRNLATASVAGLLGHGFDKVVPKVRFAMHNGKIGIVMDRAPGQPGSEGFDASNPVVRRELTKLQLLDTLVAQGDRHDDNFLISDISGKVTVTGVDNDQCFGPEATDDPYHLVFHVGFNGVEMPPVIDQEMRTAISELREDDLRRTLNGLLTDREIDATVSRLRAMKRHVHALPASQVLKNDKQWGRGFTDLLKNGKILGVGNSYVVREQNKNMVI